jgi:hypothetical protein
VSVDGESGAQDEIERALGEERSKYDTDLPKIYW